MGGKAITQTIKPQRAGRGWRFAESAPSKENNPRSQKLAFFLWNLQRLGLQKSRTRLKNIRSRRLEHIKVTDIKLCLYAEPSCRPPDSAAPFLPCPGTTSIGQNICDKACRGHLLADSAVNNTPADPASPRSQHTSHCSISHYCQATLPPLPPGCVPKPAGALADKI